jgi:hypothetical protein
MTNISSLPILYIFHSLSLENPAKLFLSEECVLLDYYAASSGNSLQTMWGKIIGLNFNVQESKKKTVTNQHTNQPKG